MKMKKNKKKKVWGDLFFVLIHLHRNALEIVIVNINFILDSTESIY